MVESVCHGDGGDAPCPCGNDGSEGHGCASALVPEGGQLGFTGSARVSGDDSELHAAFLPPNVACLFFQGTSLSVATPFGNGLRCVSGSTVRFALQQADATGSASYPNGGGDSLGVAGHLPALGGTRFYQAWYRDPSGTCGSTFNLTNALRAIWTP
jgi:hypothetical protein